MKLAALLMFAAVCATADDMARFTKTGELIKPSDYRQWVFLSSGLGMTYGPNAPAADAPRRFDNVFVNPSSYRAFLRSGTWPDGTVLILEVRESESKGSINQHGHFQTSLVAVEANVKVPNRGWTFFDFGRMDGQATSAKAIASGNRCEQCHSANGAVDSTFVQFYPELKPVALKFGTFSNRPAPSSGAR